MTIHFSVLGEKGICGVKRGEGFLYSAESERITCARCQRLIRAESASGAHCWAMEASRSKTLPRLHVRQLFNLAVKKYTVEVEHARERLETVQDWLDKTTTQAKEFV